MFEWDQEMAFECLKQIVLPFLDEPNQFSKETIQSSNISKEGLIEVFHKLTAVLLLFMHNRNVDESIEKVKNYVTQLLDQDSLKALLKLFMSNSLLFYSSSHVMQIFSIRLRWLKEKLKSRPEFSWIMPGGILQHPRVTEFLRSSREQMIYPGVFGSIGRARSFAQEYKGLHNGFSLDITALGTGASAYVKLTKTKEYHEARLRRYRNYENEYSLMKNILKTNNYQKN